MDSSVLCFDLGGFGIDEAFSFKALDILSHRVLAHACSVAYRSVAWMALKGFPILAVHEESVYNYLSGRQVKVEDRFRQWKIIAGDISFVGIVI